MMNVMKKIKYYTSLKSENLRLEKELRESQEELRRSKSNYEHSLLSIEKDRSAWKTLLGITFWGAIIAYIVGMVVGHSDGVKTGYESGKAEGYALGLDDGKSDMLVDLFDTVKAASKIETEVSADN